MSKLKFLLLMSLTFIILIITASCADEYEEWKYKGDWENEMPNGSGMGIKDLGDGITAEYEGDWKDGKPHGHGVELTKLKGIITGSYEGEWKDGKYHGQGIEIKELELEIILTYNGEWADGMPNGFGTEKQEITSGDLTSETVRESGMIIGGVLIRNRNQGIVLEIDGEMTFDMENRTYTNDKKNISVYEEDAGRVIVLERTGNWKNGEFLD